MFCAYAQICIQIMQQYMSSQVNNQPHSHKLTPIIKIKQQLHQLLPHHPDRNQSFLITQQISKQPLMPQSPRKAKLSNLYQKLKTNHEKSSQYPSSLMPYKGHCHTNGHGCEDDAQDFVASGGLSIENRIGGDYGSSQIKYNQFVNQARIKLGNQAKAYRKNNMPRSQNSLHINIPKQASAKQAAISLHNLRLLSDPSPHPPDKERDKLLKLHIQPDQQKFKSSFKLSRVEPDRKKERDDSSASASGGGGWIKAGRAWNRSGSRGLGGASGVGIGDCVEMGVGSNLMNRKRKTYSQCCISIAYDKILPNHGSLTKKTSASRQILRLTKIREMYRNFNQNSSSIPKCKSKLGNLTITPRKIKINPSVHPQTYLNLNINLNFSNDTCASPQLNIRSSNINPKSTVIHHLGAQSESLREPHYKHQQHHQQPTWKPNISKNSIFNIKLMEQYPSRLSNYSFNYHSHNRSLTQSQSSPQHHPNMQATQEREVQGEIDRWENSENIRYEDMDLCDAVEEEKYPNGRYQPSERENLIVKVKTNRQAKKDQIKAKVKKQFKGKERSQRKEDNDEDQYEKKQFGIRRRYEALNESAEEIVNENGFL